MAQTDNKTSLSSEEKRSLAESARLCEMIVEANPSDTGALETLKEIYTKLGDRENLARVVARLAGTVGGRPSASVAPAPEPAPARAPSTEEMEALAASIEVAPTPLPGKRGGASPIERRQGSLSRLGDRLVAEKLISTDQLQRALAEQKGSADKLGTILVRLNFVTEDRLVSFLSKQYAMPAITVAQVDIDPDVLKLVPEQIAKQAQRAPDQAERERPHAGDGGSHQRLRARRRRVHDQPADPAGGRLRGGDSEGHRPLLRHQAASVTDMVTELEEAAADVEVVEDDEEVSAKVDVFELKESADEAPVVRLINMILVDAIRRGASDIHLEPYEKVFRVRFRVDGVLHEIMTPPKRLEAALTSRVKIMASLDIAERRLPQDGRIKLRFNQREIDFRVSTLPTIFGEKTVMRILDKDSLQLDLTMLGFDPWSLEQFTKAIHSPYGMILITGPTGSGKTTTLYSAIHTINSPDINIMTAEDPVEYNLKGVNQVQVNDEIGRTFAGAPARLPAAGSRTSSWSARPATSRRPRSAFAPPSRATSCSRTLHTNDCPSTVARLLDMGIPPFLVSSSLMLILAQRLGRRVCKDCKEPYEADEETLVPYGHVSAGAGQGQLLQGQGLHDLQLHRHEGPRGHLRGHADHRGAPRPHDPQRAHR